MVKYFQFIRKSNIYLNFIFYRSINSVKNVVHYKYMKYNDYTKKDVNTLYNPK